MNEIIEFSKPTSLLSLSIRLSPSPSSIEQYETLNIRLIKSSREYNNEKEGIPINKTKMKGKIVQKILSRFECVNICVKEFLTLLKRTIILYKNQKTPIAIKKKSK